MNNNKRKLKSIVLSLALATAMLPTVGFAQESDMRGGGLFGLGAKVADDWFGDRGIFGSLDLDENGIYNQTYGSDQDAWGITNQTYGEEAPLGSGLLIMAAAAMGYAGMKRNKKQTKKAKQ